jgi:hypothetical protein
MRWPTSARLFRSRLGGVAALCVLSGALMSAADVLTRQLGDAFAKKVVMVQNHSNDGVKKPLSTTFTQAETNSYLKFNAIELLPTGLTQPEITMLGQNRVAARAIVDLDVVRQKQSSGGWFDPTSYLTGKLPVTASGRVISGDGKGRVELERAEVSGVPIPRAFLNQMVNFFTRTADNPKGSTVDDVFDLPANIKRIDSEPGRFTVHQ